MIEFKPVWVTPTNLDPIVEGSPIDIPLIAVSTGQENLPVGDTSLDLGLVATLVTHLAFNGVASSFTTAGNVVIFPALSVDTAIEVQTSAELFYEVIGGKIPKGMSLSAIGHLSGTPMGISAVGGETFSFTVRVTDGSSIRDRTFRLLITPIAQSAVWNMGGLPLETSDASLCSTPYRILGEVKRGEAFAFSIDVAHPDGDEVDITIVNSNGLVSQPTTFNGQLPPGLILKGNTIDGVVLPSATPGRYFFTLSVLSTNAPAPIPVMIEVLSLRTSSFKRPVKMQWVTPTGSLGRLAELEVCNISLHARNPNGGAVNYNLLIGTGTLPPGIVLNPQTGDLEGRVLFVDATTSYSFTVRAASESIFVDRTFSITIEDRFQSEDVCEVALKFQGGDRRMALRGYSDLIPLDWLYRSGDINFGLVTEPKIHVARGLYPDATLSQLDYRENILCTFGRHKIAVVRNALNEPIYEVLYRVIVDPMDQDPFGLDDRSLGLVIDYAQSKTSQQIHPQSIWNMRYDLLLDYGTDAGDLLPEWMTNASDDPGFKTAFAVSFLLPGMGKAALALLDENANDVCPVGYQVKFDRVLLSRTGVGETQFDGAGFGGNGATDSARLLPIYVPSGGNVVNTARMTNIVTEIFAVDVADQSGVKSSIDSTFVVIDQNTINMNVSAGTITFPSVAHARMLYFVLTGSLPTGNNASNAPVGSDLILGPFLTGVEELTIDPAGSAPSAAAAFTLVPSRGVLTKTTPFSAGDQVLITLSDTTFDDETDGVRSQLDYAEVPLGKYIKLSSEFKKYPA